MSYSIQFVRKEDQVTTAWSGGTTRQIAIYPQDALYSQRNFTWRLSTATVELEESVFTALPGFWRLLMVLDGEMRLEHEGQHSVCLRPFEQDSFDGGWTTKSVGKVTDFNLMMSKNCSAKMVPLTLEKETVVEMLFPTTVAFYAADGAVDLVIDETDAYRLKVGDLLLLNRQDQNDKITLKISNQEEKAVHLIKIEIVE